MPRHNLKANKSYLLSGIQITGLKLAPLYELIVQSTLKEKGSEDLFTHKSRFFVVSRLFERHYPS